MRITIITRVLQQDLWLQPIVADIEWAREYNENWTMRF